MYPLTIINQFAIMLSLSTATGVVIHDTKVDKAFVSTVYSSAASKTAAPTNLVKMNDLHTHVERGSIAQFVHEMKSSAPRINPRDDVKKHMTQKHVVRGHHPFDNYNLPIV